MFDNTINKLSNINTIFYPFSIDKVLTPPNWLGSRRGLLGSRRS